MAMYKHAIYSVRCIVYHIELYHIVPKLIRKIIVCTLRIVK